jgi:hypothetical protein
VNGRMQDIPVKLVVRVLDCLEYEGKHSLIFACEYGPNQIGRGSLVDTLCRWACRSLSSCAIRLKPPARSAISCM